MRMSALKVWMKLAKKGQKTIAAVWFMMFLELLQVAMHTG